MRLLAALGGLFLLALGCAREPLWQWQSGKGSVNWMAVGDADGDPYPDLLVGLASGGGAHLFRGSPAGLAAQPSWSFQGGDPSALPGLCVGFAGDMDGDGRPEIFVAAPRDQGVGSVFLFRTGPQGPETTPWRKLMGSEKGEGFGEQAGAIGDVNGDGLADLAVGDFSFGGHRGRLCVYYGSRRGPGPEPDWVAVGEAEGDWFGYSLGGAADLDGDGYADLVVGGKNCSGACARVLADDPRFELHRDYLREAGHQAPGDKTGKLYIYHGSAKGLPRSPTQTLEGAQPHGLFAFKVAVMDDLDGDGGDELAVSSPGWQVQRGQVEIFALPGSSRAPKKLWSVEGSQPEQQLGYRLDALPGPDGRRDLLIGSQRLGRLQLYHPLASQPWRSFSGEDLNLAWSGGLARGPFAGPQSDLLVAMAFDRPAVKDTKARALLLDLKRWWEAH